MNSSLSAQTIPVYDFKQLEPLLNKRNDTTYVINFWATWCKPCVAELPYFIHINDQNKNEKFKMILVSLDFKSQIESALLPFIKANNITPEVVVLSDPDSNKWIDKVNKAWTGAIPATIIFNKNFYFFKENTMTYNELNDIIKQNLK